MQPYRDNIEEENDKGLFTFYREQAEFDQNCKIKKVNQKQLHQLLGKVIKNQDKGQVKSQIAKKAKNVTKLNKDLKEIKQINQIKQENIKRLQVDLKKAQPHIQKQENIKRLQANVKKAQAQIQKQENIKRLQANVKKTYPLIQKIKISPKQFINPFLPASPSSIKQSIILSILKQQKYESAYKNEQKPLKNHYHSRSNLSKNSNKLAIQPKSFQGLNQQFRKRESSALKLIKNLEFGQANHHVTRQQRLQHNYTALNSKLNQMEQQCLQQQEINSKSQSKILKIQKLPTKQAQNAQSLIIQTKQQKLNSLRIPLPQITQRSKPSIQSQSSLQLINGFKNRNKYKLRNLQTNEQSKRYLDSKIDKQQRILQKSFSLNLQLKNVRNFHQKDKVLGNIQKQRMENQSTQRIALTQRQQKKNHDIAIFCKRQQYFKPFNKFQKVNIFGMQNQDKIKIQSKISQKKQQIMNNFFNSLSFN